MRLYATTATERGIRERRQRAPACLPAPEPASAPAPAPEPAASAPDNVVCMVIPQTELQELVAAIARKHGLTVADLTGPRRFQKLVDARREAMRAVKDARPCLSLTQIGRMFHRDHSVIYYMLRK